MKKGEMSIGVIIAIIIGIVILTFSIYALVTNKIIFQDKIDNTLSKSTLDDLVLVCNSESQMDQQNKFCCENKILKTADINQQITCHELSQMKISNNRIAQINCKELIC